MSFLSQFKENPLAAKANPLAKKPVEEVAPVVEDNKPVEETPKDETILENRIDGETVIKYPSKTAITYPGSKIDFSNQLEIEEDLGVFTYPLEETPTEENTTEEQPQPTEEEAPAVVDLGETTVNVEEPPAPPEEKDATEEIKEETTEEVVEEAPKKRGRKTRKKKAEATDDTNEASAVSAEEVTDMFNAKVDIEDEMLKAMAYLEDEEWKEREAYFIDRVTDIRIEDDMTPAILVTVITSLSNLRDEVMPHYLEQKKLLEALTNKDFGIAHAYRAANAVGTNAEERKRSGAIALMNAEVNGTKINFIALISALEMRVTALSEVMNTIKYKSDICITISSALKTEAQLTR